MMKWCCLTCGYNKIEWQSCRLVTLHSVKLLYDMFYILQMHQIHSRLLPIACLTILVCIALHYTEVVGPLIRRIHEFSDGQGNCIIETQADSA